MFACRQSVGDPPAHPTSADVLLMIEVADISLNHGRAVQRALYARHMMTEFWIVNFNAGADEVCRGPSGDAYASVQRYGRDDVIEPALLPGALIPLASLFR